MDKINVYLYFTSFLNVIKKKNAIKKKSDLHTDVTPNNVVLTGLNEVERRCDLFYGKYIPHIFHNDQVCINPHLPSPKTY